MNKLRKYFFGCFSNSALSQRAVSHPIPLFFNYSTAHFQLASAIKKGERIEIFKERLRHVKDIDAALPVCVIQQLSYIILIHPWTGTDAA